MPKISLVREAKGAGNLPCCRTARTERPVGLCENSSCLEEKCRLQPVSHADPSSAGGMAMAAASTLIATLLAPLDE